jgi:hypothetical protein
MVSVLSDEFERMEGVMCYFKVLYRYLLGRSQENREIQSDYKWCERFNKYMDKKLIATQKLNSHHYACVK